MLQGQSHEYATFLARLLNYVKVFNIKQGEKTHAKYVIQVKQYLKWFYLLTIVFLIQLVFV